MHAFFVIESFAIEDNFYSTVNDFNNIPLSNEQHLFHKYILVEV